MLVQFGRKQAAGERRLFDERRNRYRQKALKGAVLRFNNGYGALECTVRNLSDRGAKLQISDNGFVPQQFEIRFSDSATWRAATVRWRSMTALGIEFEQG